MRNKMKFSFIKLHFFLLTTSIFYCTLLCFIFADEDVAEKSTISLSSSTQTPTDTDNITSFHSVTSDDDMVSINSDHMNNLVMEHDKVIMEPSVIVESSFNTNFNDGNDDAQEVNVDKKNSNDGGDEDRKDTTNDASDNNSIISKESNSNHHSVTERPIDIPQAQIDRPDLQINLNGNIPQLEVPPPPPPSSSSSSYPQDTVTTTTTTTTASQNDESQVNLLGKINAVTANVKYTDDVVIEEREVEEKMEDFPLNTSKIVKEEEEDANNLGDSNKTIDINNNSNKQTDDNLELVGDVPNIELPKSNLSQKKDDKEDIPSFSEWAQKQLEEAERERVNNTVPNGKLNVNLKLRSKNYASPDCGAKIVAANPETVSPYAVLSQSKDEYLLNTCTSRIWFIVELCEAVQPKKIDLANFELFSSSPKDFSVYLSDRFPSREWSNIGNFAAKDERDIQSFDLINPNLFGKYIKVEMHSHYGSEHFCPISLFRVYGTSEYEVLEKEDQTHVSDDDDDDDDETLEGNGLPAKNLFSSATDAVISIVRKAAEVLGNKGNASNQTNENVNNLVKYTPLITTCTTPKHLVICDNCSDTLFGLVYELLSCKMKLLQMLYVPFIKSTLLNSYLCNGYGLDVSKCNNRTSQGLYLRALLPSHYLIALCNTLAILENRAVLNVSKQFPNMTEDATSNYSNSITNIETTESPSSIKSFKPLPLTKTTDEWVSSTEELKLDVINLTTTINNDSYANANVINPTKTLQPEDIVNNTKETITSTTTDKELVRPTETISSSMETGNDTNEIDISMNDFETTTESIEVNEESLDKLLSDAFIGDNSQSASMQPSITPQAQKESVFLRLSNRIKALERNMSLSSQYLEELSRRYKKQVEEMQRLLENTINQLKAESKRKDDENRLLQQQLAMLTAAVDSLIAEKSNWVHTTYWLFLIIIATFGILTFCRRNPELKRNYDDGEKSAEIQRRKSIDVVTHDKKPAKVRRPSEEALKISGTYQHLMVDEVDGRKKKRKKKKSSLQRYNSITTLSEEQSDACGNHNDDSTDVIEQKLYLNTNNNNKKGTRLWNRQESAPSKLPPGDWVEANYMNYREKGYEDVPFVLEECEHTFLEPLPYDIGKKDEKLNGNGLANVPSLPYIKTAINARLARTSSNLSNIVNGNKISHKKTPSIDDSIKESSEVSSINSTSCDEKGQTKKKGAFRRIFKKVF